MSNNKKLTPIMEQYYNIKKKYKNEILLFRMGDFYEMFGEDAKIAAPILGLTLTSRAHGKSMPKTPLAGVPYHAVDKYIKQLLKAGYNVAICEQIEDPKKSKGIVKREVVEVITPGTIINDDFLENKSNNYLISIFEENNKFGIAQIDISTGEFQTGEFDDSNKLINYIDSIKPAEILIPENFTNNQTLNKLKNLKTTITEFDQWRFNFNEAYFKLTTFFKTQNLKGFGLEHYNLAIITAGVILFYLEEKQQPTNHINKISLLNNSEYMIIDSSTRKNLELISPLNQDDIDTTLFATLDKTKTPMGSRLLKKWIIQPLVNINLILDRQKAITFFYNNSDLIDEIQNILSKIGDFERLLAKINSRRTNARDLLKLASILKIIPDIKANLPQNTSSENLNLIINSLPQYDNLVKLIDESIDENAPLTITEGGFIKKGYNKELDELKQLRYDSKSYIANLEKQEIEKTGINSLKIKYNKIFGYFIEITKAHLDKVPKHYIRKQTMVNTERFITPELKEYEEKILNAEEKIFKLEEELFYEIRSKVLAKIDILQKSASAIALLDVIITLAFIARINYYTKPELDNSDEIVMKKARHPVIETLLNQQQFVPNDVELNTKNKQIIIITGPNMAGKSTYLRMVGLLVILAQMGSYIPADYAKIGIVDRVFTRVGASDNLARGESTFLVEMNETANILNNATNKSLIILDEIGRGTSTFDGLSIAWALVEYLHNNKQIKARTLFATHYHELTELELLLEGVCNYNILVKKVGDDIVFLRKVEPGTADQSYGIEVAALAGMPKKLLDRAKEILHQLEEEENISINKKTKQYNSKVQQLTLFKTPTEEIIDKIKQIDINTTTPIQALEILNELKKLC